MKDKDTILLENACELAMFSPSNHNSPDHGVISQSELKAIFASIGKNEVGDVTASVCTSYQVAVYTWLNDSQAKELGAIEKLKDGTYKYIVDDEAAGYPSQLMSFPELLQYLRNLTQEVRSQSGK